MRLLNLPKIEIDFTIDNFLHIPLGDAVGIADDAVARRSFAYLQSGVGCAKHGRRNQLQRHH